MESLSGKSIRRRYVNSMQNIFGQPKRKNANLASVSLRRLVLFIINSLYGAKYISSADFVL